MSNTAHHSFSRKDRMREGLEFKTRNRRVKAARRQGTRSAIVAAAKKEA